MNIEEIKQKIQDSVSSFVDQVKEKLPSNNKKKKASPSNDEDDEEFEFEDDETQAESETGELTEGSISVSEDDETGEFEFDEETQAHDDEDEDEDDVDDEEAQAKRKKIVQIAGFLFVGYMAWDLLSPDVPNNPPRKMVSKQKRKKGAKKQEVAQRNIKKSNKKKGKRGEKREPIKTGKSKSKMAVDKNMPKVEKVQDIKVDTISQNKTAVDNDLNMINNLNKEASDTKSRGFGESKLPQEDMGMKEETINTKKIENKIKDLSIPSEIGKILTQTQKQVPKKVKYMAPPDYTKFGRGLVYNCVLNHWACIDRPRWFECKGNEKFNDFYGKKKECHVVNV